MSVATIHPNTDLVKVAFQGELGAFSEEAVLTFFGNDVDPLPQKQFGDVAGSVATGDAAFGMLPIENSTVGGVAPACDVLRDSQLFVVGEVVCAVRHCVLGLPGSTLSNVRRALSHSVALGQCSVFFQNHPDIEPMAVYDTAGAARQVALTGDPTIAAIAGRRAASRYGLEVLAEDIQDRADNQTRFLVLSPAPRPIANGYTDCKTALLLETANQPGGLAHALLPFADRGLNLTHLQARPGRDPWSYWFFFEIQGAESDPEMVAAIKAARRVATSLRVLGSYSRWSGGQ